MRGRCGVGAAGDLASQLGRGPGFVPGGRRRALLERTLGVILDTRCLPAPSQRFTDALNSWDVGIVSSLGDVLPFLVGIAMGAPLVAGELEQGTAPLSWALVGARWKWLAGKILAALLLIVPLLLIAGLAADVLRGAQESGIDPHASFDYFTSRGVFFVLWGVAALMGTVALGTLFGRTMPVVIVALIVCLFAAPPGNR